jgi:hypothetical protein
LTAYATKMGRSLVLACLGLAAGPFRSILASCSSARRVGGLSRHTFTCSLEPKDLAGAYVFLV